MRYSMHSTKPSVSPKGWIFHFLIRDCFMPSSFFTYFLHSFLRFLMSLLMLYWEIKSHVGILLHLSIIKEPNWSILTIWNLLLLPSNHSEGGWVPLPLKANSSLCSRFHSLPVHQSLSFLYVGLYLSASKHAPIALIIKPTDSKTKGLPLTPQIL